MRCIWSDAMRCIWSDAVLFCRNKISRFTNRSMLSDAMRRIWSNAMRCIWSDAVLLCTNKISRFTNRSMLSDANHAMQCGAYGPMLVFFVETGSVGLQTGSQNRVLTPAEKDLEKRAFHAIVVRCRVTLSTHRVLALLPIVANKKVCGSTFGPRSKVV